MLKRLFSKIKHSLYNFNIKKNNRPVVFLICLLIASVLWFVNALGKRYETTVSMPIQYTKLPKDKILVKAPPSSIQVKMEAFGSTLLQHKIKLTINPINFNVKSFTDNLMEKSNALKYKILTAKYSQQISDQVNSEIDIIAISPDTLYFEFDNIVSKKIKVISNFDLSFENQYFLLDSITFFPDSVLVTGPQSVLDSLEFIKTKKQRFKSLNASVKRNISIEAVDQLEFDLRRVVVNIPVSQYTEYVNKISISNFGVPDSLNLITFPGKIEVTCLVALNEYKNISPSSFIFGIDYKDLDKNSNTLPIKLYKSPSHIKLMKFQPSMVEYIIEIKND